MSSSNQLSNHARGGVSNVAAPAAGGVRIAGGDNHSALIVVQVDARVARALRARQAAHRAGAHLDDASQRCPQAVRGGHDTG